MDEIIEELRSTLERIETRGDAVLEFIKAKGIAKDEELALFWNVPRLPAMCDGGQSA